MAKSKAMILPEMDSMNELVDYFETHDMGDYWEQMPEADFKIKIKGRKHFIALEEDVAAQIAQIAKEKNVLSEALINNWLKEKLRKTG